MSTCSIRVSTSAFERIALIQRIDFLRTLANSRVSIERLPPPPAPEADSARRTIRRLAGRGEHREPGRGLRSHGRAADRIRVNALSILVATGAIARYFR